jgi:hypothetical protein
MLSRDPEGALCLEDGEGRVRLDMEEAVRERRYGVVWLIRIDSGSGRRAVH